MTALDFEVEGGDLPVSLGQAGPCEASGQAEGLCPEAVQERGPVPDKPGPCDIQLPDFPVFWVNGPVRDEVQRTAHERQHPRIHRIGFGAGSVRLGEAARLQRVHLHERQAPGEPGLKPPVAGAGRFKDDQVRRRLPQPGLEGAQALCGVVEPGVSAGAQAMRIQMRFRDIDADGIVVHLRCPMLVVQGVSAAAYPFRPHAKTVVDLTCSRSSKTWAQTIQPPPAPAIHKVAGAGSTIADEPQKS